MKKFGIVFALLIGLVAQTGWAAVTVNVRAGIHERYNRLVFDWEQPVKYSMKQAPGTVMIQFNVPATANLKDVTYTNPPFIRNLRQENKPEGLFVTFEIPDDSRVQAFWSGRKVAFDVLRLSKEPPTFKKADKKEPEKPEEPKPAPMKLTETTGPQTLQKKPPAAETEKQTVTAPELQKKEAPQRRGLQTLADILTGRKEETVAARKAPIPEETPRLKHETTITLTPEKLTRLAMFERVGRLWLVIDQPEKELLPKVDGEMAENFKKVTRISLKEATAFVFDVPIDLNGVKMSVRRSGPEWKVTINPEDKAVLPAEMPIRVRDEDARGQPVVTLYAGEQPVVLTFKDSKMGDTLWVVPVRSPEGRVITPRKTAAYFILPSYMGAVVAPRDDNLRIGTNDDLVVLSPASGHKLLISDMDDRKKGVILGAATPAFRLDVPVLKEFKDDGFIAQRRELENLLLEENTLEAKADRYVDMARVYLKQGFAAEASGLLRIALRSNPALEKKQEFRALRGMAFALMGDLENAAVDLRSDDLYSQPLSQLWMGYAFMQNKQPGLARDAFIESGSSDESLPPMLQPRVFLAKAEAAMENGDMASAEFELKKIQDKSALLPSERAAYNYIRATVLMVTDDKNAGLEMYQDIARGSDQLYRAKAEWQFIEQKVAAKEMPLDKGIERLEGLRFAWRGDRMEINILRTLGRLYIENNDYMNALAIWRQAASLSKEPDDTDAITQDMQQAFRKLYVEGEADKLEPLKALAIFDRFRELTPAGEDGQTAHRRLAERLIDVDLLEQADALLENQLLKQATGEEAVSLGTKLANIRLLNRNPSGAIKALQESERGDVDNEKLRKRRLLLQARALADLGRVNEALSLLDDDLFPEGLSLKADINWREGRWQQAVLTLQKLIAHYRNDGKGTMDGPMPPLILKMAIALALDDNRKGIELLTAEYGPFMEKTSQAEAFRLITKPSRGSSLADLQTLKHQVGEVELFEQFLKDFNS